MPTLAGPPLRKVTLNLYEEDCLLGEKLYGYGWTTMVRDVWAAHLARAAVEARRTRIKLGDLPND